MSEKLRSAGGILNPLDSNKPSKRGSKRQNSKKDISIFHVESRNSKLNSNKRNSQATPNTASARNTKSKVSYEVGSESEIEIYIGGPNAKYNKQEKLTPFMSRLNQEDIIVKTQKKVLESEKRSKVYDQESLGTESGEEGGDQP
jgi:hypothetical protein